MKKIICIVLSLILMGSITITAQNTKDLKKSNRKGLNQEEVAAGLKEALIKGVEKGVMQLSKTDGYFKNKNVKIPLPEEAKEVGKKLRQIGQGSKVDETIKSINRAAEDAAVKAKDIFIEAIKNMTVKDAISILYGGNDAATRYLEKNTRDDLVIAYKPTIKNSLKNVGATRHWNAIFSTYNKLPFVEKVDPDLEDYVTNKAIDGLFFKIAKEEMKIRNDPAARVTALLKKVFG